MNRLHLSELALGARKTMLAGFLPRNLLSILHCHTVDVMLSRAQFHHICGEHQDISVSDFLLIPEMLDCGMLTATHDRQRLVLSYQTKQEDRRLKLVIKRAASGHQLWISTLHRLSPRQTKSLLKRNLIIRRHR